MNYKVNNKSGHIVLLLLVMAGYLTSCQKSKLSPIPQTTLSDITAFSTPERVQQQVFGVYSALKSGQFLGGRALVYNDVRGEDWLNITGNGVTAVGVWNFSIVSSDNQTENCWAAGYAAINRANVVLEGIDANEGSLGAAANRYRGEVRFSRALAYYYLAGLYGRKPFNADNGASPGLPLRLTANKGSSGAALARSTMAQVYNQILEDLNFAELNLPLSYVGGDSNVVRAHRNTAIAMKSRVYMHMNRWADVITEANKLVPANSPYIAPSGVPHTIISNVLNVFRSPYTTAESIFSLPMSVTNSPGTQNGLGQYWTAEFALNPSGILNDPNWTTTDARRTNFVTNTTPIRWNKFNDDLTNYVPIIRYPEVMLNLAEALARTGTGVDARALALVNAVRKRSDPSYTITATTQQELIDKILTERRIEFLGEGFRSQDIMRQVIAFPAKGSVSLVPPTALAYVWPIPASEILFNSEMRQNE